MKYRQLLLIPVVIGLLTGCSLFSSTEKKEPEIQNIQSAYPAPDPEIDSLLETYRDSLDRVMGVKIATIHDTLRFNRPEGALGNLVADALRFRAGSELKQFVHLGVIGDLSFQLYLTPGELTRGEVLEFMPYDNHLVILTIPGSKISDLAHQIAALGGAPISGMRFRIDDGQARSILVNAEVLKPERSYLVATTSWAANGGDLFPALWEYTDRTDLYDVDVRELYIDYFKTRRNIHSNIDGRVRF